MVPRAFLVNDSVYDGGAESGRWVVPAAPGRTRFDAAISKVRKIKHLSLARLCAAAHCLSTLWITFGKAVHCKQNYAQKISRLRELSVARERRSFDHIRRTRQRRGLALDRTCAGAPGFAQGYRWGGERETPLDPRRPVSGRGGARDGASGATRSTGGRQLSSVRVSSCQGRSGSRKRDRAGWNRRVCTDLRILGSVRSHGPQGLRVARSGGSNGLRADRSERRQECSSEHARWAPRPRTWRLFNCASSIFGPRPATCRPTTASLALGVRGGGGGSMLGHCPHRAVPGRPDPQLPRQPSGSSRPVA